MAVSGKDIVEIFFPSNKKPCLALHVWASQRDRTAYKATATYLCESGTWAVVSSAVRARVLVALHIHKEHKMIPFVLKHCNIVDVSKAVQLLDHNRKIRQLDKRIQDMERRHPHLIIINEPTTRRHHTKKQPHKKKRAIDKYRSKKKELEAIMVADMAWNGGDEQTDSSVVVELIASGSVSGALAKKIREWAKSTLSSDFLEFVLLGMPTHHPWKTVADAVHFGPNDFAVPSFLKELYQENDDDDDDFIGCMRRFLGSLIEEAPSMEASFFVVAKKFPHMYLNYSLLRRYPLLIGNPRIMENLAANVPLDTVIWHYEEFHAASRRKCQSIVQERLRHQQEGEALQRQE